MRGLVFLCQLSLTAANSVTISPKAVSLSASQTQQFTATQTGHIDPVTWSRTPAVGTISATGLYTAPATIPTQQIVTVTAATSSPPRSDTAVVTLLPPPPPPPPSLSYTLNNNGLATLIWNGTNYNYVYGEGMLTSVNLRAADGTTSFVYGPPCTKSLNGNTITHQCAANGTNMTVVATFAMYGTDAVCADLAITNLSSTVSVDTANFSVLGITSPNYDPATSKILKVGRGLPVGYANIGTARFVIWVDNPVPDASIPMWVGYAYNFKNQPALTSIAPGRTKSMRAILRMTADMTSTMRVIVPEAYDHYRAAYPPIINWPDRRPIVSWFIGDVGKRSTTNPRGYLQDPLINAADIPTFRSLALAKAAQIRDQMNGRPVRPQGIIIWDLEGQEFIHATTYIGDPRAFASGYAPEMHAAADDVFTIFKDAGYKVGVTIRPQQLKWGNILPATCQYDVSNDYKDYFIKVDAPYQGAFYACYDPLGVQWSIIPDSNGSQTSFHNTQVQEVTDLLRSKISYARNRWGATIFYVDSAVWVGGSPLPADIFRQLQGEFPDALFIQEQETLDTLSAGIPFTDPKNAGDAKFSPVTYRWVYPEGAMNIRLPDCTGTCWTDNVAGFKIGLKVGDIALYNVPFQMAPAQLTAIESLVQQAQQENSAVYVTDSTTSIQRTFTGNVTSGFSYPMKMRVYFSDTIGNMTNSSLYCEAGQWLGENACTLNLTGMAFSETRYYDFTNVLVRREPTVPLI